MLLEINIRNFVLFKAAQAQLGPGFTAITGETGAGKSLIIKALQLLMGAKADPSLVRRGAKQAEIQALFALPRPAQGFLEEIGLEAEDELIVRRIIPREGRGRIYANGSMISAKNLKYIMGSLLSISGQHEYQDLLNRGRHRHLLDSYCGLERQLAAFQDRFRETKRLAANLEKQKKALQGRQEEMELLQKEMEAISTVDPHQDEDLQLEQKLQVLKSADRLRALAEEAYGKLYVEKGAVLEILADCQQHLVKMCAFDQGLEQLEKELESCVYQIQEVAYGIRDYINGLAADPALLSKLEERFYAIRQLKRRFGPELKDVLEHKEMCARRLLELEEMENDIAHLEKALKESEERLLELAGILYEKRVAGSRTLAKAVEKELAELQFHEARFAVNIHIPQKPRVEDVTSEGMEEVEFVFSPNIGEEPKPLASIASGGELSRVMLALRSVFAAKAGMESMIFDEIDAGIGGEAAGRVGAKLRKLAGYGQVIAITHFPQIAALADCHLQVSKRVEGERTVSTLAVLSGSERLDELKRMLGDQGEEAASFASRLLKESR